MFKNLFDYLVSINANLPWIAGGFLLFLIFLFVVLIKKSRENKKEKERKENPLNLSIKDVGRFFKVLNVDYKMRIILLGCDPSPENPLGIEDQWYKIGDIPKELQEEGKVIRVVKNGDGITIVKNPVF